MNKQKSIALVVLVFIVGILAAGIIFAQEAEEFVANHMTAIVNTHPATGDVRPIPDSQTTLLTNDDGAWFHMITSEFENGHVYTIWWVIMNNPDECATRPCTPADVFGNSDGVQAELTLADTFLMDDEARISLAGYLPVGDVENPWFGNGFTNPTGAEIWVVVNHHGPLIPEEAGDMLNTYRGGCTDDSANLGPFPEAGMADGKPGPNACQLYQIAVFAQGAD